MQTLDAATPLAWFYELATKKDSFDYSGWEPHVSLSCPNVPVGSIRNLKPLYTLPSCSKHCAECEGEDHHWMEDCDEETGNPVMVCKHCETTRPYTFADGEI